MGPASVYAARMTQGVLQRVEIWTNGSIVMTPWCRTVSDKARHGLELSAVHVDQSGKQWIVIEIPYNSRIHDLMSVPVTRQIYMSKLKSWDKQSQMHP